MAKYKQFYVRGYPFDTGHWDEFDQLERLEWLRKLVRITSLTHEVLFSRGHAAFPKGK